MCDNLEGLGAEPDFGDEDVDFDELYNSCDESQLKNVQAEHGSVVMHLLSQVSIGMDLTKIVLPTFILERRSLLEMYADFFAHPDLFVAITAGRDAESRMVACVKWYLSSFHAGRRSSVAKKPYNPIIGETFSCHWEVPITTTNKSDESVKSFGSNELTRSGPYPSANDDKLTFVAEQMSHHPPISAFYAEHVGKRMQCSAHIWTKSKFLGLSIGVHMVGEGCITLIEHNERYTATFPSAYGRSILTTPWIELGGKVNVVCDKTGYMSAINFHTKPFYGGKTHILSAEVFAPGGQGKPFLTIKGEWNGEMKATYAKGHAKHSMGEHSFLNVTRLPISDKLCVPTMEQGDLESRKLWRHVTNALHKDDIQAATRGKQWLELRQRLQAKARAAKGAKWVGKNFALSSGVYDYKWPLKTRIATASKSKYEQTDNTTSH